MTPDEVEAIKVIEEMREGYHKYGKTYKALTSVLTLIQDYQKLRGLIDKAQVRLEQARILSVKEPMQLSDRINLNGIIREAITYLQQPTEH
jgi:hypothetical protein